MKKTSSGFTIVELLIVIVVIGILAVVTIVAYNGMQKRAADSAAMSYLAQVKKQLLLHKETSGIYPASLADVNNGQGASVPSDMTIQYTPRNDINPVTFSIVVTHKNNYYSISDTTPAKADMKGMFTEELHNNIALSGSPTVTNYVQNINYNWAMLGPSGVGVDNFSARWTAVIVAPQTGAYTFFVSSDDGQRLYVNGVLVVDNWVPQGQTTRTATMNLTSGDKVALRYEYYESGSQAVARLEWTPPGGARAVLNAS